MGTSKGYIAPSTPAWSQAKRSVSRFLSNPTSHERGNTASKYAQAMTSGSYSTEHVASIFSGVINFSSTSSSHGYATARRNIHREDILSLTPAEALSELVSHFANDGSTIDDKIALDCISESFEVLDISDPDDLQNIDANRLLKEMVCQFAKLKFAQMFDKQIRFKCPIIEEANARIAEMQEFIYYTMEQQLTPEILREINPQNLSNASIVQNTINKGFELMTIFYGE